MLAQMISGELDAADVCFFVAAIVFLIAGALTYTERPDPTHGSLIAFGLCLVAVGFWVT